jgi:hypothetical protein
MRSAFLRPLNLLRVLRSPTLLKGAVASVSALRVRSCCAAVIMCGLSLVTVVDATGIPEGHRAVRADHGHQGLIVVLFSKGVPVPIVVYSASQVSK